MSQFYLGSTAGTLPPSVAEQFNTDLGNAVPIAHVLLVNGKQSNENNNNGIITKGGVVGTGTQNEVDIVLTNRIQNTVKTTNATPTTLTTFPLGSTDGVYNFLSKIAMFDFTNGTGAAFTVMSGVRTIGGVATVIGLQTSPLDVEDPIDAPVITNVTVSGNSFLIQVQGLAGTTVNWSVVTEYVFVPNL